MENQRSLNQARHFYDETWAPERIKLLKDLKSIKEEVQRQAMIYSIGSITYSSTGLFGAGLAIAGIITAPFTFGASLGLTVAGVATGLTSGIAGITHGAVKLGIVRQQLKDADTFLKKHDESDKKMKRLLHLLALDMEMVRRVQNEINPCDENYSSKVEELFKDVVGLADGVEQLVDISKVFHVYDIAGRVHDVEKFLTIGKLHSAHSSVHVAIGIVTNLASLTLNAIELSRFNKGQLCYNAQRLRSVIEQLQQELDDRKSFMENVS